MSSLSNEERLIQLEKKIDYIMQNLGLNWEGSAAIDKNAQFEIRELIRKGKKIQAIKHIRAETGWGLKQAKDYADNIERGG